MTLDTPQSEIDWENIKRICCETGKAGGLPIEKERWPFFVDYWISPYQKNYPEWTYLLKVQGQCVGYLTASPETLSFVRRRRVRNRLPLLLKILAGKYPINADTKKFLKRTFLLEPEPESRFSSATLAMIQRDYPAHLHMNLSVSARGQGLGKLLIQHLVTRLKGAQIAGVHLCCAEGPVKFYKEQGFIELEKVTLKSGISIFMLGRLTSAV